MLSKNGGSSFFAGLVTGGVVGAGLALLLAPQSGEETRSQMKTQSFALKDGAAEGLAEAGHHAHVQVNAWQEKGQEVSKAIGHSKDSIVQAVNQSKDSVVEAVSSST